MTSRTRVRLAVLASALLACLVLALLAIFRQPPWILDFSRGDDGALVLTIQNDRPGMPSFRIRTRTPLREGFPGQSVRIVTGNETLPVGRIEFFDGTLLPGHCVVKIDRNAVGIMKRCVTINGREYPWTEGGGSVDSP